MSFVEDMKAKAVSMQKKLVLPEGTEPRTLAAARIIKDEKIASEVFLSRRGCRRYEKRRQRPKECIS